MIQRFTLTKPQTTPSKVLGATAGLIPRSATAFAGIPRSIGDISKYINQLNPANKLYDYLGVPEEARPEIGLGKGLESLLTKLPSSNEMNKSLKSNLIEDLSSPVRNYIPRNTFDPVPYLDNPVQAIATAPLFGASRLGTVIPAFTGEAFGQTAEKMHAPGWLKFLLEGLGFFAGEKGQQGVGALAKYAAPTTSKVVQNFAEKYIPGAKTYNKVATQEQRVAQKAEQSLEREESKVSSMRYKMNQEAIDEATEMDWEGIKAKQAEAEANAKEAERLKSEVQKSNKSAIEESTKNDVAAQKQRDFIEQAKLRASQKVSTGVEKSNQAAIEEASKQDAASLNAKEAEAKVSAKEAERLKGQVEKSNQASIDESSSQDADIMRRRTANANQIDKFQAQNDHIMSLQDAGALKDKIKKGETVSLEDWLDKKAREFTTEAGTHARTLQDMHTQEGITMSRQGASPKEVKARITRLFENAEKSIPETLEQGAAPFEGSLNQLEKMIGVENLTGTPQETIKEIIDGGRRLIKNGRVKVRDLIKFKQTINGKMRKLRQSQGNLIGVENKYHVVNDAIDKTMKSLQHNTKDVNIAQGIEDWFEGNRMTKNLAQDAQASAWFSSELNKGALKYLSIISEKGGHYFKSPEVRKYVNRAVARYSARDLKQATRDMIMADKAAENILEKEKITAMPKTTGTIKRFKVEV